jgi:hypothetical protein
MHRALCTPSLSQMQITTLRRHASRQSGVNAPSALSSNPHRPTHNSHLNVVSPRQSCDAHTSPTRHRRVLGELGYVRRVHTGKITVVIDQEDLHRHHCGVSSPRAHAEGSGGNVPSPRSKPSNARRLLATPSAALVRSWIVPSTNWPFASTPTTPDRYTLLPDTIMLLVKGFAGRQRGYVLLAPTTEPVGLG